MQKHLITRITQTEMNVLIRTDSRILLFAINNIVEAAASHLQCLCWAFYGHLRKKAPSCPKEFTWGSYQHRMVRGKTGGGKRRE